MSEEEQIILPNGYTKLDWIAGDGASYLELPIKSNRGDKLVLETNCRFFSLDNQAEAKNGNPYFFFGIKSGVWYCGAGTTSSSSVKADTDWHKVKLIHSAEDTGLYLDGTKILSQTYSPDGVVLGQLIALFKTWNGTFFAKNCKKDWKLFINDELIFDLIPCLDGDNVPCMYDLVTKQTFYNQGSGTLLTPDDFIEDYPQTNLNYNLPANYKKCLYLQSDGTQWINTKCVPDNETGIYFRGMQLSYGNFVPFGVEESSYTIYPPRYNNTDLYYKWGSTAYKMMTHDKAGDYIFASYLNFYNSKIAKFISEDTNAIMPIQQAGTFTIPIWLFSLNYKGSFSTTYGKWAGRIYRAKITQGGTLIHDFVPCLDANDRPCMYDLMTETAFYNQSGGTEFTYCVEHQLPSDFIKLDYLESTGTQIIKTGIVPTDSTGIYVDAYHTKRNGDTDWSVIGLRDTNGNTYFTVGRVQRDTNGAGFGWGAFTTPGGNGNVRYEASLNFCNDRQSVITAPAFAQRINALSTLSFTPTKDLYMFGMNNYDGAATLYSTYRIYRAKISEGSEIVRDYVPAYDEVKNKPCMYDLINNVAYYNDGEGDFVMPPKREGSYTGFAQLGGIGNRLGGNAITESEEENGLFLDINENVFSGFNYYEAPIVEITFGKWSVLGSYYGAIFGNVECMDDPAWGIFGHGEYSYTELMEGINMIQIYKNDLLSNSYVLSVDKNNLIHKIKINFLSTDIPYMIEYNNEILETRVSSRCWHLTSDDPGTYEQKIGSYYSASMVVYEVKLWDSNNNLISHMIPHEENGQKGLYCTVRNLFLPVQSW